MLLSQDLAGEADKQFNLPFWEKPLTVSALLCSDVRENNGISEASDVVLFSNLFSLYCYETRTFVEQNPGEKFGLHLALLMVTTGQQHAIVSWNKHHTNHKLPLFIFSSFTQQGQRILSPSPTYSPSSAQTFHPPLSVSLFTCQLLWPSQSSHTAHLSICTLTRSLQPELVSGDSTRLTLMTQQNRKVN